MRNKLLMLLAALLAALFVVSPVMAAQGHIYGIVFVDTNLNGVWDMGEVGMPGVKVMLQSANGDTTVDLMSAPNPDEISDTTPNTCDYLNSSAPTPCPGTWGLIPAGETTDWWKVSIVVPAGYTVTSANPQWVQVQAEGSSQLVYFGLAPVGAGGPTPVLLPATGAGYELYAAGLSLVIGLGLTLKSRLRKK